MSARWFCVVLAVTGCNSIFGLRDTDLSDAGRLDAFLDLNDEDGDDWNNSEDNCPGITNRDQADGDGDLVGDVCDPRVSSHGDRIAARYFFNNPATDGEAWGGSGWSFERGHASQPVLGGSGQLFAKEVPDGGSFVVEIGLVVTQWDTTVDNSVGVQLEGPGGPRCFFQESSLADNVMTMNLFVPQRGDFGQTVPAAPAGVPIVLRMGVDRGASLVDCKFGATYTAQPTSATPGVPGVFTNKNAAQLDYVVVYTRP